ncbi:MAG: DUF3467 domain-containing protein [Candidatus Aenigmarchaeota archaeon]|nr:DUF3467 domain-containing protein [Candidatus Aenigmarchaeota archaeon]
MADEKKQKISMSFDHNEPAFFSNEVVVSHVKNEFIIDYKQNLPRNDIMNGENIMTLAVKHKPIVMRPELIKSFFNILKENINGYEKKFGEIKIPEVKSQQKNKSISSAPNTNYFG